jgi:hypothetical protein
MPGILAEITSLEQHIQHLADFPQEYRPSQCPHCYKAGVWIHGYYGRTADHNERTGGRLNPIPIPRFFCPHCRKTCSTLPECIPPRRWYLWTIQQVFILSLLTGGQLPSVSPSRCPGRVTIGRWWNWLKEKFPLHADTLRARDPDLGRVSGFHEFWRACLDKMPLSEAMYWLHKNGLTIP